MATPNKNASDAVQEKRNSQLNQLRQVKDPLKERQIELKVRNSKQLSVLQSVALGLYDEVDKLAKKAPAEPVTDLVLDQMNTVVRETKELVTEDAYVQRLHEFVAAGDNPQHRDAVVVLRQVREGLVRFAANTTSEEARLSGLLAEIKAAQYAINYYLENGKNPVDSQIREMAGSAPPAWLTESESGYSKVFNFDRLDAIDIAAYFSLEGETT